MTKSLLPAFPNNNIPIAFAVTNNYVQYFGVCLWSIISNSSSKNRYDIVVLESDISFENKERLKKILPKNFSIRYIDMKQYMANLDKSQFYISGHITLATYYRFFIPQIFKNYKKIIYLDSDLVVTHDIADLFSTDVKNHVLAAATDTAMCAFLKACNNYIEYAKNVMQLPAPYYCFNAGVLICNISKMNQVNFTNNCIKRLNEIKKTWCWDQDILNSLYANDYLLLDQSWNVQWHTSFDKHLLECLPTILRTTYHDACQHPKIIHYTSNLKAWNSKDKYLAQYFWKYARTSIFYEEILYSNVDTPSVPSGFKSDTQKTSSNKLKKTLCSRLKQSILSLVNLLNFNIYCKENINDISVIKCFGIPVYKKTKGKTYILGIKIHKSYKQEFNLLQKQNQQLKFAFAEFQEDTKNYIEELKSQIVERPLEQKSLAKIFCTYHYQDGYPLFQSDIYIPIQTGAANSDVDFGILKDNTGDNISDKNDFFAELTATYWVWKNWLKEHPEVKYIGACHHYSHIDLPRIHPLQRQGVALYNVDTKKFVKEFEAYNIKKTNIDLHDIILPKKVKYGQIGLTLFSQFCSHHPQEIYEEFESIIKEFHPECTYLLPSLRNLTEFYLGNTYVMRRDLFDDYCQWMFPMLFELERRTNGFIKYDQFAPKMKRMPPYISERFINLWLILKQKQEPIKIGERTWIKLINTQS